MSGRCSRLVGLLCTVGGLLYGSSTATWELTTYQDFLRGRLSGLSLSAEGVLTLAGSLQPLFTSGQPAIWSTVQAPDGSLYIGTGHRGRVYRLQPNGQSQLLWTAQEPEIFALALDAKGTLYAATSPDGKVYRIVNGQAQEYFAPNEKYIWSLACAPDGSLYVGTGESGKLYRVTGPGQGELYYETGQAHLTALAIDAQGRVLAGSEPNGILYRITGKNKAFVLYDANLPEIRTIVPQPDGSIYVAALGGSVSKRVASTANAVSSTNSTTVTAPTMSITVQGDSAQNGPDIKPKVPEPPKQTTTSTTQTVTPSAPAVIDVSGVEKSAVYRIQPDNTVETLWTSKEENAYDLLASGPVLYFSTDGAGRIYQLTPDRHLTLVAQTNEGETTRLLRAGADLLAATGSLGRIYRLSGAAGTQGTYESPVHDAGSVARWGQLRSQADGGTIQFRTRTGNVVRPDQTWSEWSAPLRGPATAIPSPNARYIQWQAEFRVGTGSLPSLHAVSVAYLPQNNAPVVRSVTITSQWIPSATAKPAANPNAAYSVTVTDTPDPGTSVSTGTAVQNLGRTGQSQLLVSWQADDADNDKLIYTLAFRGEGEQQWKTLRTNFAESALLLDADVFADGRYAFRVTASDRLANPGDSAREAEMTSAPVLLDNTPPVVTVASVQRNGAGLTGKARAVDASSPLRRAEYAIDGGTWQPLFPVDGVLDSPQEEFALTVDRVSAAEHVVTFRVFDAAGNAGLAKTVVPALLLNR